MLRIEGAQDTPICGLRQEKVSDSEAPAFKRTPIALRFAETSASLPWSADRLTDEHASGRQSRDRCAMLTLNRMGTPLCETQQARETWWW
jgi:hypothetical protein